MRKRVVFLVMKCMVALFLVGYLAAFFLGGTVAIQYTVAVSGFVIGIVMAILYDRHLRAKGGLSFTIVRLF